MILPLILLVTLLVTAVSTAVYVYQSGRLRRELLTRVEGGGGGAATMPTRILIDPRGGLATRIGDWLSDRMPGGWLENDGATAKLVHAGFDGAAAPIIYSSIRLGVGLLFPAVAFVLASASDFRTMLMAVAAGTAIGVLGPPAVVDRLGLRRRDRIRFALPDALDLLVVCVEAGVSLDAAILRVARDMSGTHRELANEFMVVNRRVNAGIPRERALHGLWERTGLDELRALASSMVQCEKWGTSIAKVLRINAETLRRKRKQMAEKRAAEAGLKMLIPLMLFLLPALFVVILGPAVMRISDAFGGGLLR